jgi:hypothetical protein
MDFDEFEKQEDEKAAKKKQPLPFVPHSTPNSGSQDKDALDQMEEWELHYYYMYGGAGFARNFHR